MAGIPVPEDPARELQLVVDTKGRLHVELDHPGSADEFELRDEQGVPVEITLPRRETRNSTHRFAIVGASALDCEASCRAVVIVLLKQGKEVRSAGVEIRRGKTSTVRL